MLAAGAPGWAQDLGHLDGLDEAAFVVDPDGVLVGGNSAADNLLAILGGSDGQVVLADVLVSDDERGAFGEVLGQALNGTVWSGRLVVRTAADSSRPADLSCAPVRRAGAVVGALWVLDTSVDDRGRARDAHRVADRLTRLTRVTAELGAAGALAEVTEVVTRHAADAVGATVASLSVLADPDTLVLAGLRGGREGADGRWQTFSVQDRTPAGEVVRTGRPLIMTGRDAIAEQFPELERAAEGERAMVCLPLQAMGRILGVFTLSFPGRRVLDTAELEFLGILSDSCAQALERLRAQQEAADQSARVRFLADVTAELATSLDYQTTLRNVARMAIPEFADWTAIDVVEDDRLHRLAVEHVDPEKVHLALEIEDRYPSDREAAGGAWEVVRSGNSVLIDDIRDEMIVEAARDEEHLRLARSLELTSILMVPLMARGHLFGVMTWATAESGRRLTPADVAFAEDLARRSAVAIDNSQLHSQILEAAGQLQEAVLPVLPELLPGWEVAAHYAPAGRTEVGGDFYDALCLPDGRMVFFVGDVMGRGVEAAAAMAQMRAAVRAFAALDPSPSVVMENLDRLFDAYGMDQLVTLVYGLATDGAIQLTNAGHPPPLVVRTDGTAEVVPRTDEPPLGVGAASRRVVSVELGPGDSVLAYTDGLVERRAEDLDDGITRLLDAICTAGAPTLASRLHSLVEEVRDHSRDDDVAALLLRRTT